MSQVINATSGDASNRLTTLNHYLGRQRHVELINLMDQYDKLTRKLSQKPVDIGSMASAAAPLLNQFFGQGAEGVTRATRAVGALTSGNDTDTGEAEARRLRLHGKRDRVFAAIVDYAVSVISTWLGSRNIVGAADDDWASPTMVDGLTDRINDEDEDHLSAALGEALAMRLREVVRRHEDSEDEFDQTGSLPAPEKLLGAISAAFADPTK